MAAVNMYFARPVGIAEPAKLTAVNALCKLVRYVGAWSEQLHISTEYQVQRITQGALAKFAKNHLSREITDQIVTDTMFDGINVRIYEPRASQYDMLPALVFIHGGGWATLSVEDYDEVTRDIADLMGQVVLISIDYNLAPEHIFPGPVNDCYKATKWLLQHAADYGIDENRIGISGDSAGGNLAASVVLRLKVDKVTPKLAFQVLVYPALQSIDFTLPSYQQNKYAFDGLITTSYMPYYWLIYAIGEAPRNLTDAMLKKQAVSELRRLKNGRLANYINHSLLPETYKSRGYDPNMHTNIKKSVKEIPNNILRIFVDPYFAPLLAEDLSGLPETYIITAEFDVLRDDGILYYERLKEAGVQVTLNNVVSGFHGMLNMAQEIGGFEVGIQLKKDIANFARLRFYPE
ncbi:arylacetamide deacetylase-like [Saccoglossus kowalevskii]|uniref:Arylacetamide deacetylase-like n=1 Tax=Saccoglossus kowalevskii TaxID=10224 RepID=A0ABM0GSQ0_SACKO|nr:PREDICTED: arylacetamide deacetylase-like [Saccoglossus kowalevskii]